MSAFLEGAPHAAVTQDAFSPAVVMNPPMFDGQSEEALALRFSRKRRKKPELTYEFTRDPVLLHQYFRLYDAECRVVDIPQFRAAEENYNRKGHIIVVRQGNLCVGGARISLRTPRNTNPLPLEIGNFRLEKALPELNLAEKRYAELSRLVLLPQFRTGDVTRDLFYHFYRKSLALGVNVMFAAAPMSNARMYKVNCNAVGLQKIKIHTDLHLPPYPGFEEVKDYLISAGIEKNPVGDAFTPSCTMEYQTEDASTGEQELQAELQ